MGTCGLKKFRIQHNMEGARFFSFTPYYNRLTVSRVIYLHRLSDELLDTLVEVEIVIKIIKTMIVIDNRKNTLV